MRKRLQISAGLTLIVVVLMVVGVALTAFAPAQAQTVVPLTPTTIPAFVAPPIITTQVPVTTGGDLVRISWGAVLAAALVGLVIELALNLLGIGIGFNSINPKYGEDSATPQGLAQGTIVWVAVSTIISLFTAGALAGRFAGWPSRTDGLLNGLVAWAVMTVISLFLLTTSVGRIISGATTLIGQGLSLAGSTVGGVARVASGVAGGAAQAAGGAIGGVVQAAGSAVGGAAQVAGSAAQAAGGAVQDVAQDAIESRPEVANALRNRDQTLQMILDEGRKMLNQAGVDTGKIEGAVQEGAQDVKQAAQRVAQNPSDANQVFNETLSRVLNRAQGVNLQADRDAVVKSISERTGVTTEQAQQQVKKWEDGFAQARGQADQTLQDAQRKADELRKQAEAKAAEVQRDAEKTAAKLKADADRVAREAADATAKIISRLALAAFGAILAGAIAAGIGGYIGAPDDVRTTTTVRTSAIIHQIDP